MHYHKECGFILGLILLVWAIWPDLLGISTRLVAIVIAAIILIHGLFSMSSICCSNSMKSEKPKTKRR